MAATNNTKKRAASIGFVGGADRAVALLHRLESSEKLLDACTLEPGHRPAGRPQRNLVLQAMDAITATGDRDALEGFCAMLTGCLALAACGFGPESDWLQARVDQRRRHEAAASDAGFQAMLSAATSQAGHV